MLEKGENKKKKENKGRMRVWKGRAIREGSKKRRRRNEERKNKRYEEKNGYLVRM